MIYLAQVHGSLTQDVEVDPGPGRQPHPVLGDALVHAAVVPTHVAHAKRQTGLVDDLGRRV